MGCRCGGSALCRGRVVARLCRAIATDSVDSRRVRVATLGYAIPGLVLAVALMVPLTSVDKWLATLLRDYFDVHWGC